MPGTDLADALTREHHAIDTGIEAYIASLDAGGDPAPLLDAMHALRRHIYLEELFLFPPLKKTMMMPIFVMLREHGELWRAMDVLDAKLSAHTDPADLREHCQGLLAVLDNHNKKEEPVVYPRADSDLTDDARDQLAAFLDSGTFPDGWVCEKAAG